MNSSSRPAPPDCLAVILDTISDAVIVTQTDGVVLFANAGAERLFGRGDLVGKALGIPVVKGDKPSDIQVLLKDGLAWAELRAADIDWGDEAALLLSLRDVTERHQLEHQLSLAAKVFEASHEGILITDTAGKILLVNPTFSRFTGYSAAEVLGANPRMLKSGLQDAAFYRAMWAELLANGHWQGEIWNRRKDGTVYPEMLSINRLVSGGVTNYVGVFSDLSERKAVETRLEHVAHFDALTGLLNRAMFKDRLGVALAEVGDKKGALACVLVNIDRMRMINDAYGLSVGDRLLFEVAQRLLSTMSEADTLARMGADEFGMVLAMNGPTAVTTFIHRVLQVLEKPFAIEGNGIDISTSIGVAFAPDDAGQVNTLLAAADTALQQARSEGIGNVRFYHVEMNRRSQRWLQLEGALRRSLELGELSVHYQPQVHASSCMVIGVEALLRWKSAEFGQISPAEFIPIAERCGMIIPIGTWVMNEACKTVAGWHRAGLPALRLAVNVSGLQLMSPDFPDVVDKALERSGLGRQYLELEVTESVMIGNEEPAILALNGLRALGLRLALDDFGTGYSSLSYINRLEFDLLKIDQSFVRQVTTDPRSAAIARATISMSHSLGIHTIAEGVETEGQMRFLRTLHCGYLQGYLFARPMPAPELEALLTGGGGFPQYAESSVEGGRTLLCVDDEEFILTSLRRQLRGEGYQILIATSGEAALELLGNNDVQVIISDQRMPTMSGTEFFRRVKEIYPDTVRIMLSGYTDLDSVTSAVNSGAIFRFLTKPWDDDQLKANIKQAFEVYESLHKAG